MSEEDYIEKRMLTAQANMIAQGLVTQDDNGLISFTPKGMKRVEALLDAMPEEDLALVTGYFKTLLSRGLGI